MKLLAVTSCPMGIAHTYMAAEALQIAAEEMGHYIKVETHGAIGVENEISEKEILEADVVIIAADKALDKKRFQNKIIVEVPIQDAVKNPKSVIEKAISKCKKSSSIIKENEVIKIRDNEKRWYKHLMTGISFMIPFIVVCGVFTSLSKFIAKFNSNNIFLDVLNKAGTTGAFELLLPIFSGYISYSIAESPGIAPGVIGGYIAWKMGMGFFGALISGYLSGYIISLIKKYIKLPKNLESLSPTIIIPLFSTFIVAFIMMYLVGTPMQLFNKAIVYWLNNIGKFQGAVLGIILGSMMAIDAGGPINKAAYTFAVAALSMGHQKEMAAVMAAGMVPPIGLGLATIIAKNRFSDKEIKLGVPAIILGTAFITEGAIPFITVDAKRVMPSIVIGSSITALLSMVFNCTVSSPLGGVYVFIVPNVVGNLILYLFSLTIGVIVTIVSIIILKKNYKIKGKISEEAK